MKNLLENIPKDLSREVFESVLTSENLRIERIVSKGHTSPDKGWYDQKENEWVIILQGSGTITFENGEEYNLNEGDCLNISAHKKHRVSWTKEGEATIWLAIFY